MLQRLIAAVLGVLGLAAIALGIASATAWRADDTLTARAAAADGTTLVTTAPGVLELGDAPVTVRATARDGSKVVVAVGRDTDVAGWVGSDAHTVVTGLSDWHSLATDEVAAEPAAPPADPAAPPADPAAPPADPAAPPADPAAPPADPAAPTADPPAAAPDPDGSDLWVQQSTGEGSAELTWTPQDGRWTVLVASAGEAAAPPSVELSWPRTVTTPWLLPGVIGGALLLLVALLLGLRLWRGGRRDTGWHPVVTGATPVVGVDRDGDDAPTVVLSRREMRDAAAAAAAAAAASRPTPTAGSRLRTLATGETPSVTAVPQATGSTGVGGEAPSDTGDGRAPSDTGDGEAPSGTAGSRPTSGTGAGATASGTADSAATSGTSDSGATSGTSSGPAASAAGAPPGAGSSGRDGTADPGEPPASPGGSRADAWRRAWGFPGATPAPEPGTSDETTDESGQREER